MLKKEAKGIATRTTLRFSQTSLSNLSVVGPEQFSGEQGYDEGRFDAMAFVLERSISHDGLIVPERAVSYPELAS